MRGRDKCRLRNFENNFVFADAALARFTAIGLFASFGKICNAVVQGCGVTFSCYLSCRVFNRLENVIQRKVGLAARSMIKSSSTARVFVHDPRRCHTWPRE